MVNRQQGNISELCNTLQNIAHLRNVSIETDSCDANVSIVVCVKQEPLLSDSEKRTLLRNIRANCRKAGFRPSILPMYEFGNTIYLSVDPQKESLYSRGLARSKNMMRKVRNRARRFQYKLVYLFGELDWAVDYFLGAFVD